MTRLLVALALTFFILPSAADAAAPKMLARLDGTLSGPAAGAPQDVALDYVRGHLRALGLSTADLGTLQAPTVTTGGDITTVRWRQAVDGIPAADSDLRVNLDSDGRVLNVVGQPAHGLRADTTPRIGADAAVRAATGTLPRAVASKGVTRATSYADGTTAELALDDGGLMWRVGYRASSTAVYDAFVDAHTGALRRRVNLVKSVTNASVWENFPSTAFAGGLAVTRDLEQNGWLAGGAPRLSGPNVRVFADLDDDNVAGAGEEIAPPYNTKLHTFVTPTDGGCSDATRCTWTQGAANSWGSNVGATAIQAFYFANRFHDHLAAAPIGFNAGSGSFDGGDPLVLQIDDGAATAGGLPDGTHVNNANMFTPPDGSSPVMQMYLWRPPSQRTVNGADDASIVYHEYTHGLSNRLVKDADGRGALNSPQAGAMGEGWSDWYAKDFLVAQFPTLDGPTVGDVDMGTYTDQEPHAIRTQGLDCTVGAPAANCPAAGTAGPGGYTYGDFGKIFDGPEVHHDGEIWAQTLWDLRRQVGSQTAERLITGGMRLLPPEPSFLDARNAILLADGGPNRAAIWSVFATRGMGFYASTNDRTTLPLEDFSPPPLPSEPRGAIAGVVRDAGSGQPIAGATAAIGGLTSGPDALAGTSGGDGGFAIANVPAHAFPSLVISAPGYDAVVRDVTVGANATTRIDVPLARNWAAGPGGAATTPGPGSDDFAVQGCGPDAAVDQRQGTGWSTRTASGGKSMVVTLPTPVDVTEFVVDPGESCGDDLNSATRDYRLEASAAGAGGPFAVVAGSTLPLSTRHALTPVAPVPTVVRGVRAVRLTMLSNQGGGGFLDFSELAVHGSPPVAPAPAPVPATPSQVPPPAPTPPPSFSLPARGNATVKFKVTCAQPCRVTAKLTVDRPTAKKLGMGKKLTIASLTKNVKAGTTRLTMKLASKAKRALERGPKKRTYRARLKATAAYAGGAPVSRNRQLTLKR